MKKAHDKHAAFLERFDSTVAKLNEERIETKEMLGTFSSLLTQHLPNGKQPTNKELKGAIEQLKDVHRMAAILIMSIVPGSVITLPAIYALGKKFGVEILPSAFRKEDK
ncbi:hypothetical protein A9Q81_13355 [Gammaproteobacteria bacterium 42_54_T18]|nr:hypothetical protein A9Q81_13355 [Gammaproteobacteria bacterium 42_54_T18]